MSKTTVSNADWVRKNTSWYPVELDPTVVELADAQRRITELENRLSNKACSVCWTISWEPVEDADKSAISDGQGGFMRCLCCWQRQALGYQRLHTKRLVMGAIGDLVDLIANEFSLETVHVSDVCDALREYARWPERFLI